MRGALKIGILAGLGILAWKLRTQMAQAGRSPSGATPSTGEEPTGYDPMLLDDEQRQAADLIIMKATAAGLDPNFMLALAVTESSLRPAAIGDDGVSVGLFQINTRFSPDYSITDLQDASLNAELAMSMMQSLRAEFPGYTYADYAEAWTLGGNGRFNLLRRNPPKVAALRRAVTDLGLNLDINGVA